MGDGHTTHQWVNCLKLHKSEIWKALGPCNGMFCVCIHVNSSPEHSLVIRQLSASMAKGSSYIPVSHFVINKAAL